jgi:hypothetical protein
MPDAERHPRRTETIAANHGFDPPLTCARTAPSLSLAQPGHRSKTSLLLVRHLAALRHRLRQLATSLCSQRRAAFASCRRVRVPRFARPQVCCVRELNCRAGDLLRSAEPSFFFLRREPTVDGHHQPCNDPAPASASIPPTPRCSPARPTAPSTTDTSKHRRFPTDQTPPPWRSYLGELPSSPMSQITSSSPIRSALDTTPRTTLLPARQKLTGAVAVRHHGALLPCFRPWAERLIGLETLAGPA